MLLNIMFFTLGILSAGLLAMLAAPILWRRAVWLTQKSMRSTIPTSFHEVEASKDQLRAEFAVSTRRLEQSVALLQHRTTNQLRSVEDMRTALNAKTKEAEAKSQIIAELEAQDEDNRSKMDELENEIEILNMELSNTRHIVNTRGYALSETERRLSEKSLQLDRKNVELSTSATQIATLRNELERLRSDLSTQTERDIQSFPDFTHTSNGTADEFAVDLSASEIKPPESNISDQSHDPIETINASVAYLIRQANRDGPNREPGSNPISQLPTTPSLIPSEPPDEIKPKSDRPLPSPTKATDQLEKPSNKILSPPNARPQKSLVTRIQRLRNKG